MKTSHILYKKYCLFFYFLILINLVHCENKFSSVSYSTEKNKLILKLENSNVKLSEWFTISSPRFFDKKKYPSLPVEKSSTINSKDINQGILYKRINTDFKNSNAPSKFHFYFRLTNELLYYSFDEHHIVLSGVINLKLISDLRWQPGDEICINIKERNKFYSICGYGKNKMKNWFCKIQKFSGLYKKDEECNPMKHLTKEFLSQLTKIKTIVKPLYIIPKPTRECNENWNYNKKGEDWECLCKEGKHQSPIDLPPVIKTTASSAKPLFRYHKFNSQGGEQNSEFDYNTLTQLKNQKLEFFYAKNLLKLKYPNMGNVITLKGSNFIAQEILFHTPSEHTINGQQFEMEMQIIHKASSIKEKGKQVVLSFLFKAYPGAINKFIEKLDFFNLPNPSDTKKIISSELFIPYIFDESDKKDSTNFEEGINYHPFSFYSYEGSYTAPPCSEQSIYYVASDPIKLSKLTLQLFKEALKNPDSDDSANIENNRKVQPINGRKIYYYNHVKYEGFDMIKIGK
jgi:carbonic anhydrase